jgi:hypothetical protein
MKPFGRCGMGMAIDVPAGRPWPTTLRAESKRRMLARANPVTRQ